MPYGIPAERGGESEKNVADMEACVNAITGRGKPKDEAIPICKVKLGLTTKGERDHYERHKRKH